ncbi:MAG TPA: ATP-NAD kinase family protein [Candidatus Limnocylindrales bacterium]|nr:ATP-NAD kinase family protein [Candidatus Limnocylindrales bacterium]
MPVSKESLPTKTLGLIVNPVAGMGGAVGLKGTDGKAILDKAISLGARPVASERAGIFLNELLDAKNSLKLIVGAGIMGEAEAYKARFDFDVKGESKSKTTFEDTDLIAKEIARAHVDLLVFCGGDGTARDVLEAIGMSVPVLGVPTGVKMHSAVFAVTPQAAARVVVGYLWGGLSLREAEVMDIDEQAFREGHLSAELYGYVLSPYEPHLIQGNKLESPTTENEVRNQAAIAVYVIEEMKPNVIYIIGPGTTTRTVSDLLDQKKTLLGVDIFQNKKIIAADANEKQILETIKKKTARIIVTPIGGQGFIFGRGNQQISAKVVRRVGIDNIVVVATKSKLDRLNRLRVDTGDPELDQEFRAREIRVVTDYKTTGNIKVE